MTKNEDINFYINIEVKTTSNTFEEKDKVLKEIRLNWVLVYGLNLFIQLIY